MKAKRIIISLPLMTLLVLAMMVGGCEKQQPYDSRLVVVDSIMHHDPDSALALLKNMNSADLATAGDQAYYALLLTQARYRCYVVATSDSTINTALDYYRHHDNEREKLTRAYIYKGAVMEELGDPKAALNNYQEAKSIVAPDDLFNQGYIRLRLGCIYRNNYVADSADVMLFKEALDYFTHVTDTFYMATCLGHIGSSYVKTNKDSVLPYLKRAVVLAKTINAVSLERHYQEDIATVLIFSNKKSDIEDSKQIVMSLIQSDDQSDNYDRLLNNASCVLAKLNKPDSAYLFLKQIDRSQLIDEDQVFYEQCCAEIAKSKGDINEFKYYYDRANDKADSIVANDMQRQLRDVEMKYDNEALKYKALKYKTNLQLSLLGALLLLSVLAIALMMVSRKSAQRKRLLQESQDTIERLHGDTARLAAQLAKNEEMSEDLKQTIRHQIDTFTQLVEMHYQRVGQNPRKFVEHFKKSYSVSQPDLSFWTGIRAYADSTCGGIITHTLTACPSLNETDVRFLSLCCCDLPTTVIMACMGYNDSHSFYNKKRRIAEAIGLKGKLDSYIQAFRSDHADATE